MLWVAILATAAAQVCDHVVDVIISEPDEGCGCSGAPRTGLLPTLLALLGIRRRRL